MPAVQSGALAPLRSSFLKRLVESGEALQKRQDLPEAAFWDVAAFQRLTELEDCPGLHFRPVVPLAHGGASGPRQLPPVQGRCLLGGAQDVGRGVMTSTWTTTARSSGTSARCSSRSAPLIRRRCSARVCGRATCGTAVPYTTVLIQPHLPPEFTAAPYTQSGWCFVEATISSVIKMSGMRFDTGALELDSAGNLVMDEHFGTVMQRCGSRRFVPLRPDVVRNLLFTEKKFTTDADKAVVADLYESFFNDVAGSCTELGFGGLRWTDKEIRDLAVSLRLFEKLEKLDLSCNNIGDEGAVALAGALKDLKHLELVDLEREQHWSRGQGCLGCAEGRRGVGSQPV